MTDEHHYKNNVTKLHAQQVKKTPFAYNQSEFPALVNPQEEKINELANAIKGIQSCLDQIMQQNNNSTHIGYMQTHPVQPVMQHSQPIQGTNFQSTPTYSQIQHSQNQSQNCFKQPANITQPDSVSQVPFQTPQQSTAYENSMSYQQAKNFQ